MEIHRKQDAESQNAPLFDTIRPTEWAKCVPRSLWFALFE